MPYKRKRRSRLATLLRPRFLAPLGLVLVILILAILELTNVTHFFHNSPTPAKATIPTTTTSTKPAQPTTSNSSNPTSTPTPTPPTDSSKDTGASGSAGISSSNAAAPVKPYGTFVSNSRPSLSDPQQDTESSVCSTTPGATCSIAFTNGSLTRNLPAQAVGDSGTTSWTWKLSDAQFSTGHWVITVTATTGGKSVTSQDSMDVQP